MRLGLKPTSPIAASKMRGYENGIRRAIEDLASPTPEMVAAFKNCDGAASLRDVDVVIGMRNLLTIYAAEFGFQINEDENWPAYTVIGRFGEKG